MKRAVAVIALLVAVAGVRPLAQQPQPPQQPQVFSRYELLSVFEVYLESYRQQAAIPGMSAALVQNNTIVWERGFGYQDVGARIRATPDTPYLVGDVTSTLATVLLLQCVEQRRLELDQPMRRYSTAVTDPDATLRQVLSHTSTEGPAGGFLYSPERFAQATHVMEYCAPQPYRKSAAHRILNRLAMIDSVPGTDLQNPDLQLPEGIYDQADLERYRAVLKRMAVPYRVDTKGRAERTTLTPVPIDANGGLVSTVRDLAKFEGAIVPVPDSELFSSLLRSETLSVAWNQASNKAGVPVPMGLGWFVQPYRSQRVVWHFGNVTNAYSSLVIRIPAYDLTFILLANSDRLTSPYQLQQGDVTKSPFANLFLRLFIL